MSNEPLCNLSACTMVKLCTLGVFTLGVSLVSRIVMISAICMYVVDKQYDEISLTSTAGSGSLWCICSHMIIFGLSVRLS